MTTPEPASPSTRAGIGIALTAGVIGAVLVGGITGAAFWYSAQDRVREVDTALDDVRTRMVELKSDTIKREKLLMERVQALEARADLSRAITEAGERDYEAAEHHLELAAAHLRGVDGVGEVATELSDLEPSRRRQMRELARELDSRLADGLKGDTLAR